MKKITLTLLSLGLLLMVGCSGQNGAGANDSANSATQESQNTVEQFAYELTNTGVGPIQLGMAINDVPESVENLYDKVVKECDHMEFTEYCLLTFTSGQDTVMQGWFYDANYDKVFNLAVLNVYTAAKVKMDPPAKDEYNTNYNSISDPSLIAEMPE